MALAQQLMPPLNDVGARNHDRLRARLSDGLLRHGKRSRTQHHRPPAETDIVHEASFPPGGTTAAR